MRKPRLGRASPPGGNWRVCRSFLRHLGKENVAKYAKVQQGLPPKRLCHALYWTTVHDRTSRFSRDRGNPLASRAAVENVIMRFSGKCDDLTLKL